MAQKLSIKSKGFDISKRLKIIIKLFSDGFKDIEDYAEMCFIAN